MGSHLDITVCCMLHSLHQSNTNSNDRLAVAFITAGVCTSLGRQIRHLVRPFFLPENNASKSTTPKLIYDILSWLTVQSLVNYFVAAFLLLSWHDCLLVWTRMGWAGHILIGTVWAGLKYGGAGWLKGMNAKAGRAGGAKKSK
jgi:lysophospholipid acyltransferase